MYKYFIYITNKIMGFISGASQFCFVLHDLPS